jgi:hypothetical protein
VGITRTPGSFSLRWALPGVPRLLAGGINPVVESFLVGEVQVNLGKVAKDVGKLIERDALQGM